MIRTRFQVLPCLAAVILVQMMTLAVVVTSADSLLPSHMAAAAANDDNTNNFNDNNFVDLAERDSDSSFMSNSYESGSGAASDAMIDDAYFARLLARKPGPFQHDASSSRHAQQTPKRSSSNRLVKKVKPIIVKGYSMDINIEMFRSHRRCDYDEVCKNRYKQFFECVCPKRTLCVGQGSLYEARCSTNLAPYVWVQSLDEAPSKDRRF